MEYSKRREIFKSNYLMIQEHNETEAGFSMGVNKFADWTIEEFQQIYNVMSGQTPDDDD